MINVFWNDQMISGMTKVDDLTVCVWESGRICIDSDFLSQFSTILTLEWQQKDQYLSLDISLWGFQKSWGDI